MQNSFSHFNVETIGNGPKQLVMLHGWGHSLEQLRPLAQLLAPYATIHLIDLPGFGKSQPPDSVWNAYDYATYIMKYLDSKKIPQAYFLGHSFGGKISMCAAVKFPDRVKQLFLFSPSGLLCKRSFFSRLRMLTIKSMGKLLKGIDHLFKSKFFSNYFAPRYGSSDYLKAGNMRPILVKSVNEDLSLDLKKIRCPALLLWGEKDQETPLEMGHRLSNLIPNSKLLIFPHKDHMPFQDVGAHLCAYNLIPILSGEFS